MKRRKFLETTSLGLTGIGISALVSSCQNVPKLPDKITQKYHFSNIVVGGGYGG